MWAVDTAQTDGPTSSSACLFMRSLPVSVLHVLVRQLCREIDGTCLWSLPLFVWVRPYLLISQTTAVRLKNAILILNPDTTVCSDSKLEFQFFLDGESNSTIIFYRTANGLFMG